MTAGNAQGSPTQFVLKLDNAATLSTQSVSSGSSATYAWNTGGVASGAHTLNLSVTDGAGRTATASVSVTVAPPPALTGSITSPASGATVSGMVTVNMAAGNAQGSPTQFVLQLDSATTLSTQSVSAGATATYGWDTSAVASGAHSLNLSVTEAERHLDMHHETYANRAIVEDVAARCRAAGIPPARSAMNQFPFMRIFRCLAG